jgi:hypothetical protein
VLAAPVDGHVWAYSTDGGVTWILPSLEPLGALVYSVTALDYDSVGARWVFTLDSEEEELVGHMSQVWAMANPSLGVAAAVGTAVPGRGPHLPIRAWGLAVFGDTWFVGAADNGGGYGAGNVIVTRDGAATWDEALGIGNGSDYGIQLRRTGGYLVFGNDSYLHAISERLAP